MTRSLRSKPIIERADNRLTNGRLRLGRKDIRGWDVCFQGCGAEVFRASATGTVLGPTGAGHVEISQSVRAWPNVRYRLDVHVEPAGRPKKKNALAGKLPVARGDGGPAGSVQVRFASVRAGQEIREYEPPVMRVGGAAPVLHRAVFQCPLGTGRLQVRLRFQVEHPVVVKQVRLVETGDYLLTSHALANLPPPSHEPPPYSPDGVLLCDGRRNDRPLLRWLQGVFGKRQVQRVVLRDPVRGGQNTQLPPPSDSTPANSAGVAPAGMPVAHKQPWTPGMAPGKQRGHGTQRPALVIDLPNDRGPALQDLLTWSDKAVVIVSLPTFAAAASREGIKGIRMQDRVSGLDMPCGRIVLAGYHSRGFALADVMPYTWNDGQDDFAHRYLTIPKQAKAQLAAMGMQPTIVTECGQRDCDKHPLVLQRTGQRGALVVMDPDGLEQPSAGQDVPRIFDLLWRNALGLQTVTLGLFCAPPTHYEGMMADLVELARYYDLIEDLSVLSRVHGHGNWPPTWLLPAKRHDRFAERPVLLIRTGFAEGDWPAVYGLILWLKRLALAAARNETAGRDLLQRMRILAWPIAEPQHWRGCPKDVTAPRSDLAGKNLLAQIDLRVGQEQRTAVLVPDAGSAAMVRRALGRGSVDIRVSAGTFEAGAPAGRGTHLRCKVLLTGAPQPFPANSPFLTDLATGMLQGLVQAVAAQPSRARKTYPPGRG